MAVFLGAKEGFLSLLAPVWYNLSGDCKYGTTTIRNAIEYQKEVFEEIGDEVEI